MSTDTEWMKWGERDPYFAVMTLQKYRASRIDEEAKAEFLGSGAQHFRYVLDMCRRYIDPKFRPRRALDFGCGVGRVTLPMATEADEVLGIDVSPAMLAEARRNAAAQGLGNVQFLLSDDSLSAVTGLFDFVHSFIVFQHLTVDRGRHLFGSLIEMLTPGGLAALHVTYAKSCHAATFGQTPPVEPPAPRRPAWRDWVSAVLGRDPRAALGASPSEPTSPESAADPEMLMTPYNLSELFFYVQGAGVMDFHVAFTDHGGELGVFLFFRKPAAHSLRAP